MRKMIFPRISKAKEICIKCKDREICGTGEARKFHWCIPCYQKIKCHIRRGKKKNGIKIETQECEIIETTKPRLKENSRHWDAMRIRLKSRFRHIAIMAYGRKCLCCGVTPEREPIEVDHILPTSIFPEKEFDLMNTQTLCRKCNTGKSNKSYRDFRTNDQRRVMCEVIKGLPPNDQILRVNRLRKDMKSYVRLSVREQVTGLTGKSS